MPTKELFGYSMCIFTLTVYGMFLLYLSYRLESAFLGPSFMFGVAFLVATIYWSALAFQAYKKSLTRGGRYDR